MTSPTWCRTAERIGKEAKCDFVPVLSGALLQINNALANGRLQEWPNSRAIGSRARAHGGERAGDLGPAVIGDFCPDPVGDRPMMLRYQYFAYHALIRLAPIRANGENRSGFAWRGPPTACIGRLTSAAAVAHGWPGRCLAWAVASDRRARGAAGSRRGPAPSRCAGQRSKQ